MSDRILVAPSALCQSAFDALSRDVLSFRCRYLSRYSRYLEFCHPNHEQLQYHQASLNMLPLSIAIQIYILNT